MPNPLPTGSALRIDLTGVDGSDLDILVTDLSGREIYRLVGPTPWSAGTIMVPTDSWARGAYQITVRNGGNRASTQRVVIP